MKNGKKNGVVQEAEQEYLLTPAPVRYNDIVACDRFDREKGARNPARKSPAFGRVTAGRQEAKRKG